MLRVPVAIAVVLAAIFFAGAITAQHGTGLGVAALLWLLFGAAELLERAGL